jgi:gamma-aminobutyrate permease
MTFSPEAGFVNVDPAERLEKTLAPRHITMIALGGIIGAGLFIGSGASIAATGPAIVISYAIAGLMILMVMRMLGEMATSAPGLGSFTEYARLGLGNWAGFATGWLYWYFWVVVVGIEAIAGAKLLQNWIQLPVWQLGTLLLAAMAAINFMSTRAYGEFEFWFASIKVSAIILFILIALGAVLGIGGTGGAGLSNLTAHGGFMPRGAVSVLAGVTSVIFALTGAEIATIAAAESPEPARAIAKMTNSVVWRILIFYIVSIFLIVSVLPWNDVVVGQSPFAQVLAQVGIPGAATVMNLVVLTAILSCLNSGLYVCSRVLFTLSQRGDAPRAMVVLSRRQVPARSILIAAAGGFVTVLSSILSPDGIFAFLVNACGVTVLIVYLIICVAQIRLRHRLEREAPDAIGVKMWLFPWASYATIAAMGAVLLAMAFMEDLATQLYLSLFSFGVVLAAYAALARRRAKAPGLTPTTASGAVIP